jgi:hypothetical protein
MLKEATTGKKHPETDYVSVDSRLDQEREDLPLDAQLRVTQTTSLDEPEAANAQVIA